MSWLQSGMLWAQAAQTAATPEEQTVWYQSAWFMLIVAAAIIAASFGLGRLIAKSLRLPDYAFRIGLVIASIVGGSVVIAYGWPPKLGVDLSGGVILIYEVKEEGQISDLSQVQQRIQQRLEDSNVENAAVRTVPPNRVEVSLDGVSEADRERAKDVVGRIVLNNGVLTDTGVTERNGAPVLTYEIRGDDRTTSNTMDLLVAAISRRVDPSGVQEVTIRRYGDRQVEIIVPKINEAEIEDLKRRISTGGRMQFRIVASPTFHRDIIDRALSDPRSREVRDGDRVVARWVGLDEEQSRLSENDGLVTREGPRGEKQVLIIEDVYQVGGEYLLRANESIDEMGRPAVAFTFNTRGAQLFGQLTGNNLPDPNTREEKPLGIILDDKLMSVANIKTRISDSGQITGDFNQEYVEFLVGILNAGSLPAVLNDEPITEQKISPQLGAETVKRGQIAMVISMISVLLFTAFYYRFSGIIACIALVTNLLLLVAIMILIKAAFTLPGIAGLVLTVGMAVDSNVLIFERMREELERGAALRMAIRNGFSRATTTIIDSNLTTLITAIVLFWIGSDQIKGFAVTLILGIVLSMYTAIYMARLFFDIADRKRWVTTLKMTKMLGKTNFDFLGKRAIAVGLSTAIIVAGIAGTIGRGANLFDIDFTGGTSVQIALTEPMDIAEVRRLVEEPMENGEPRLQDVAVSSIGEGTTATEFKIDSSAELDVVQQRLQEAFGDRLRTYSMEIDNVEPITPAGEAAVSSTAPVRHEASFRAADANLLAMADEFLLAQAEGETPENPEAPTADAPTADAPTADAPTADAPTVDAPAAQDEPAADPAPEAPTSEPAAQETTPDTAAQQPEATAPATTSTTAAEASPTGETTAPAGSGTTTTGPTEGAAADPFAGGTSVNLSFPEAIRYDVLTNRISAAIERLAQEGRISSRPSFDIFNPEYEPGESHAFRAWQLKILLPADEARVLAENVKQVLESTPVFPAATEIGGRVAGDTQAQAIMALLASCVFIIAYIWLRFQHLVFGLAAVVALVHDLLITVGILALSAYFAPFLGFLMIEPFKISLSVMAAVLTVMGYSLNDTIVVFDRIREVRGKSPELTPEMVNLSVNQTLSRTLLTGITTMMVVLILYIWGGPGLHAFAFTLLVGIVVGTFSSIYIAAPVLLWMSGDGKSRQNQVASRGQRQTSASA